jgi:hypothetical protein
MDSAVKPQNDYTLIFHLHTNFGTMWIFSLLILQKVIYLLFIFFSTKIVVFL